MRRIDKTEFAVVDVETTGLFPHRSDRVVEIAVVRLLPSGVIQDEYVTLVNPERDIGPTSIHGITTRDVLEAPRFQEIVGDVIDRLAGTVVVGHNVRFDSAFLRSECKRAGVSLPMFPTLCTLCLTAKLRLPTESRCLPDCCDYFDIDIHEHHSAASDARACAQLLCCSLRVALERGIKNLEDLGCDDKFSTDWPQLPRSGKAFCRDSAKQLQKADPHYLARLVTRLMGRAVGEMSENCTSYMALLDRVLEDRLVSDTESDELFALAQEWGLSGERICAAHRDYLGALARAALADGVVSDSERKDLLEVTRLLGFDIHTLNAVLDEAMRTSTNAPKPPCALAGKSVCFTGELTGTLDGTEITRETAQQLAMDAGLTIAKNVTKSLDILVVADPHSLSGKARKARGYGTRIMAEMAFWRAIGASVD